MYANFTFFSFHHSRAQQRKYKFLVQPKSPQNNYHPDICKATMLKTFLGRLFFTTFCISVTIHECKEVKSAFLTNMFKSLKRAVFAWLK